MLKYASLDIETTGLDPDKHHVLQVALVVDDGITAVEELPTFNELVRTPKENLLGGDQIALEMNAELIDLVTSNPSADYASFRGSTVKMKPWESVWRSAISWLHQYLEPPFYIAGKNVGTFDLKFMSAEFRSHVHHRVIELGSVALGHDSTWWDKGKIPGMKDLGIEVAHDALTDAFDNVKLLRGMQHNRRELELQKILDRLMPKLYISSEGLTARLDPNCNGDPINKDELDRMTAVWQNQ